MNEALLEVLKSAKTKDQLFKAAQAYAQSFPATNRADPEHMAEVMLRLRACANNANPAPDFVVPFSMKLILNMGRELGPLWYVAVSNGAYQEVLGSVECYACMDPITNYSNLLAGELASAYGTKFYTDALYHPEIRMLAPNCVYVMSADGNRGHAVRVC
jgi:hypothetical protein